MYAIVRTGGKQYRVSANDVITVEKLPGEEGGLVEFGDVLMIGDGKATTLGTPLLDGALVTATILAQEKADKVLVFKKKRRHNYRRMHGHRQDGTVLRIDEVVMPGATPKPRKATAPKKASPKTPAPKKAEKPAPKKAETKKAETKTTAPKKAAVKKPAAKKAETKTSAPKTSAARKAASKTPAPKTPAPRKSAARKPAAKKK